MIRLTHANFDEAIKDARSQFPSRSEVVHPARWQAVDVSNKPEMATHEVHSFFMCVPMKSEHLSYYRDQIKPNLPWADDHFDERVCREPINPGVQWAKWPYAHSANSFRDDSGQFNHNYMERYWPRFAGKTDKGELRDTIFDPEYRAQHPIYAEHEPKPHWGIRCDYGDLDGVVRSLVEDPLTRQAYLPIFFPEDTGDTNEGRKPCSLGYHFMLRRDALHMTYYLRSCDFIRHFRDDLYLTARLLMWVRDEAQKLDERWKNVGLGTFTTHIVSLHMFRNDWYGEFGRRAE